MARKKKDSTAIVPAELESELGTELSSHASVLGEILAFEIVEQHDADTASGIVLACAARRKELEEQRTSITGPLLEAKRRVDALFAPVRETLERIENALREKLTARLTAQRAEQDKALAAIGAGSSDPDVLAVAHGAEHVALAPGINERRTWDFEITDLAAVPREYCRPSPEAIREAVRSGVREIAGVRIFERSALTVRP